MSVIAAIGVAVTVILATLGFLYRRWNAGKEERVSEVEQLNKQVNQNSTKLNTIWRWAFGREDDETDGGLSKEIQNGFDRIEEDIQHLEKKQETYHESEMEQFNRLVNALHDEEKLDFERDDVKEK